MRVDGKSMRSIWLEPDGWSVGIVDQTALPHRLGTARLTTIEEAAHAIRAMLVRGAPLIGATAAYGVCLALRADASDDALDRACANLLRTRPTAINLKWALDQMVAAVRNRARGERVTAAGDVCNKIGTYLKALAARDNTIPFYVALPSPTIDFSISEGLAEIPIEEREADEVATMTGRTAQGGIETVRIVPDGSPVANYGFDVTPARLITGLITERGVIAASREALARAFPERAGTAE